MEKRATIIRKDGSIEAGDFQQDGFVGAVINKTTYISRGNIKEIRWG